LDNVEQPILTPTTTSDTTGSMELLFSSVPTCPRLGISTSTLSGFADIVKFTNFPHGEAFHIYD